MARARAELLAGVSIADLRCEDFTTVCGRRQGLAREPPSQRELLARHDEAGLDPLESRCLAARGCTSQAAGGLNVLVVRGGGLGVRHSRSNTSRPRHFYALFADRQAQSAKVFAEAPNGASQPEQAPNQGAPNRTAGSTRSWPTMTGEVWPTGVGDATHSRRRWLGRQFWMHMPPLPAKAWPALDDPELP